MLYCFLDTNVFLQFQTFDELDWLSILETDAVCLVVAKKVIQELDEHKNNPLRERLRKRSRMILSKLIEYEENEKPVRSGVSVKIQTTSPKSDWLERNGYDISYADDKIVGAAHYFKEINPDYEVLVFSDDTGVRLKARANHLSHQFPPDEIKLPEEPDPLQRENQELKREILKLSVRTPKLLLKIKGEDGNLSNIADFHLDFTKTEISDDAVEMSLAQQFEMLKYVGRVEGEFNENDDWSILKFSIDYGNTYPTREQVDQYHQQLDRYIKTTYKSYLKESVGFKNVEQHFRLLNVILENSGTAPGENVEVQLHIPDGIDVFEEPLLSPIEPTPPRKPKVSNILDKISGYVSSDAHFNSLTYLPRSDYISEVTGPSISIQKTNSFDIDWGPVDLKHHFIFPLHDLYLYFNPVDKPLMAFEIDYIITADNLPDKVEGKLIIRVHKI